MSSDARQPDEKWSEEARSDGIQDPEGVRSDGAATSSQQNPASMQSEEDPQVPRRPRKTDEGASGDDALRPDGDPQAPRTRAHLRPKIDEDLQAKAVLPSEAQPDTDTRPSSGTGTASAPSWRPVIIYCVIAYALAWLAALPLWIGSGLTSPAFMVCSVAMMFTPTIAAVIVTKFIEHRPIWSALGIKPNASAGRTIGFLALAMVVIYAVVLLGMVSSALFGTYKFDLANLSGFRMLLDSQLDAGGTPVESLGMPLRLVWALQFVNVVIGSVINVIPAAGEEVGWRGYLFPRLLELTGPLPAVLISGVVWGLWHAPLILLGYNYPSNPGLGLLAMCVFAIGIGAILAWLRQKGGSIWPAALAHGSLNAAAGSFMLMFADADFTVDTMSGTIMGWGGWPVLLVVVVVLLVCRAFGPVAPHRQIGSDHV